MTRLFSQGGQDSDIVEFFGVESGAIRLKRICNLYQIGENRIVKFFNENGDRLVYRDPINQRKQASVDRALQKSILARGLVPGVAGEAWFAMSPGEKEPYLAITFGGRSDAVYALAADKSLKTNPYLTETLRTGILNCRIFTAKMPTWVRKWLRDYHNSFHKGAGYSFLELLKEIPDMEVTTTYHHVITVITT